MKMYLHIFFYLFSKILSAGNETFDDVKNVSSYSDINLLLAVQILLPTSDSKDFVDRASKRPIKKISEDFKQIQKDLGLNSLTSDLLNIEHAITQTRISDFLAEIILSKKKKDLKSKQVKKLKVLNKFIEDNFHPVGYDIVEHYPEDFNEDPVFIKNLKDSELILISKSLNSIWIELSRKKKEIKDGGESTLLNLPFPFMIPGGRFREFYYWDTFWILEGLLVCDMTKSAENIVRNFISIIKDIGYIPNGTRKYYLHRSQPPFFSFMLLKLLDYENGKFNDLVLGEGLEMALKEQEFWDKSRKVEVEALNGEKHYLNAYHVRSNFPRPESFSEDVLTFERQDKPEETVFSNIKSGAESGWDFSSRWLAKETELKTIEAYEQIPVDLNAFLYRNEAIIYTLLKRKGDDKLAEEYLNKLNVREKAINAILWNEKEGSWNDYVKTTKKFVDYRFYFSNITPMMYGIKPPGKINEYDILYKYKQEIFGFKGGIPASGPGIDTLQQWDYPNVWAPHQHMTVEYLLSKGERNMAFHVAKSFFNSIKEGFKISNAFFEKYHCNKLGYTGAGGEYAPQTGFGWTNGTALSFILKYGDKINQEYDFEKGYKRIESGLEGKKSKGEENIVDNKEINVIISNPIDMKQIPIMV